MTAMAIVMTLLCIGCSIASYYFGRYEGKTLADLTLLKEAKALAEMAQETNANAIKHYQDTRRLIDDYRHELEVRCKDTIQQAYRIAHNIRLD